MSALGEAEVSSPLPAPSRFPPEVQKRRKEKLVSSCPAKKLTAQDKKGSITDFYKRLLFLSTQLVSASPDMFFM